MNINPFIDLISQALGLYSFILISWIILSILVSFNVVNRHQMLVSKIYEVLYKLTEPLLRRIRRYMPNIGAIDLSPIVVFLGINFIQSALYTYLYNF